jgi:plastocyanin
MSNETLFYICGIGLAVSAVLISIVGLKVKSFPGKAFPLVILWFAILVGGATTFAVLHAQDEEQAKAAEDTKAGKQFEAEGNDEAAAKAPAKGGGQSKAETGTKTVSGPGGTLHLAASESDIAYDTTSLHSKPGKVTIDFMNPSSLEHDVAIEDSSGEEIAVSEVIAKGKTSISADLALGNYTYYCTVPGHREEGMEGTLTVK